VKLRGTAVRNLLCENRSNQDRSKSGKLFFWKDDINAENALLRLADELWIGPNYIVIPIIHRFAKGRFAGLGGRELAYLYDLSENCFSIIGWLVKLSVTTAYSFMT
jgi:hypothetical protein